MATLHYCYAGARFAIFVDVGSVKIQFDSSLQNNASASSGTPRTAPQPTTPPPNLSRLLWVLRLVAQVRAARHNTDLHHAMYIVSCGGGRLFVLSPHLVALL
jgi:hypothetical protein